MRRSALAALVIIALLPVQIATAAPADDQALLINHLLNRLGYGPRPGDVKRVRAMGVECYVDTQLHPERIDDATCEKRLAGFRSLRMSSIEIGLTYSSETVVNRVKKKAESGDEQARRLLAMIPPADERGNPRDVLVDLASQKLVRAVHSERQLDEVMVDFWMNHFNIYWLKGLDRVLLTAFERDAIRPHAMGKFRDLLNATAHSPAMLVYLDNWQSTAETDSPKSDATRKRGLNENYAREIMELHTLGVDGGYTQQDVIDVARCFTGWTIDVPRGPRATRARKNDDGFVFRLRMHDNGQKVVLGHAIAAGGGEKDGLAVIDLLARNPNTARFISLKLCRRFVCDDPPAALVDRMAAVFTTTDGDIREVMRAIITSPEFRSPKYRAAKIKTPFELVVSAIRAVNGETEGGLFLANALRLMGMPLYLCLPPTGYPDRAEAWVTSGGLLARMSFASALSEGRVKGVTPHPEPLLADLPADPNAMIDALGERIVGRPISSATVQTLRSTVTDVEPSKRIRQTAGLLIGSPEFQRK